MKRQELTDARSKRWACLLLASAMVLALIGQAWAERSETVTYYHTDGLGSVIAASDQSGNLLWRERYRPFGERLEKAVSTGEHALYYTGKPHDDAIGLTYFGARYYDPVVGRFMGIDPAGVDPGNLHSFNRYAYANNNPYRYVDPDGRIPVDTLWDGLSVIYDIGKASIGYATGNTAMVAEGLVDAAADAAAMFMPYVPAGSTKLARTARTRTGKELVPYYPPNRGFLVQGKRTVLQPGTKVDRYGFDGGTFLAPQGTPAPMRALPPGSTKKPYSVFKVEKSITVEGGKTAPAFGQIGLGTQYELPGSVTGLLKSGVLKRVGQ